MMKSLIGAIALGIALLPAPAFAQTRPSDGQMVQPSSPNSGAGIQGQPGNKSGPAAKESTTGAAAPTGSDRGGNPANAPEAAKVPGLPGGKSGPTVRSPSSTSK
jgi:hypothetical protein